MLETIAMWGGVAGVAIAIIAIIILLLTRQNIVHILDRDTILFDQNFEIKQKAINSALSIVDDIVDTNASVKNSPEFLKKAKLTYNDLMCVLSDVRIADEFYAIAVEKETAFNEARIAQFKLMCRKDIGLKVSKSQIVSRVLKNQKSTPAQPMMQQTQYQPQQYVPQQAQYPQYQEQQAQPIQPTQPQQPAQPQRLVKQMQQSQTPRPSATRPTRPGDKPRDDGSLF